MTVSIAPSQARGTVAAPPSKSMAHRLLLAAGLAYGTSTVSGLAMSRDIEATITCPAALGATVSTNGDTATVTGCDPANRPEAVLECLESGSTLRFLLPLCLLSEAKATLCGTEKLLSRPLSVYETICKTQGIAYRQDKTSVMVQGRLQSGDFRFRGDISSQFVTGLLYALPLLSGDSTITLLPPVESRSYIDLTLSALHTFGIEADWRGENTLSVRGGQTYMPQNVTVEGDWSNAAFLEGLNLLGGDVTVTGLAADSLQGDRVYRAYFRALEAGMPTLDLSDCPDLGPVLFALAAAKHGATFTGVERLRLKESDRVAAMQAELLKFGVRTDADAHTLTVYPGLLLPTAPLDGHNDHRVVMSLALLCTVTGGRICGAEAVRKSFPDFFERLKALGVNIYAMDQQQ